MADQIMIDIETLATRPNAAIISIAAVKFKFSSDATEDFYCNVSAKSSKELGLVIDPDTVEWWSTQPAEVRKSVLSNPIEIVDALEQLRDFIGTDWKNAILWCNGMNFDYPVLEWAYKELDQLPPWRYYNLRDFRTVAAVFGLDMREFPRVGMYHNALDDCKTQIAALKSVLV